MLHELRIENFAIIDRLDLDFVPGLVVFTGETGAGKSIIIDAVESLLGSRVDSTVIREGADYALVEAVFEPAPSSQQAVNAILEAESLREETNFITLGREIRRNGRNVARANGRTVNASLLRALGEYLVDVHGQSEHLSLLRVGQHLGLLDSFANVGEAHQAYLKTYRRINEIRRELVELRRAEGEAARMTDTLTYQINEIESARLREGEDEQLREERNRLANAEGLASLAQEAIQALDEGSPESPAATDLIGQVQSSLSGLTRLDPSQAALLEQAQLVSESLADLARSLRDYLEGIEFNPKRLNQIEERLNLLHLLKRKYGNTPAASIKDVLAYLEKARNQLDAITHAGERIEALQEEEGKILVQLGRQGQELSQKRHAAAELLEKSVETELAGLNMSGAQFKVSFTQHLEANGVLLEDGRRVAFDATGLERVEFLVAPNPGEGLKPLVKIASGGETSRLMLAIKNVLARADQVPTLIFDEIDQGIGGRVGTVVGNKLWNLARQHQVLCVTHLPQLAVFGDQHYRVQKEVEAGRTFTRVEPLAQTERVLELAQMMGDVSDGTRQSAAELIENARKITRV